MKTSNAESVGLLMDRLDHHVVDSAPVGVEIDNELFDAGRVAEVVAGMPTVGAACDALRDAGWRTTTAGNRITVNDEVCVQFLGLTAGPARCADDSWVIYRIASTLSNPNGG